MKIIKTSEKVQNDGYVVIDQIIVDDIVVDTDEVYIEKNIMNGTTENDSYKVNSETDIVNENINSGTDTISSIVSYCLPDNVENLVLENVVKKENINGKDYFVYGNPEDDRWNLDYDQNDDGVVKRCDINNDVIDGSNTKFFMGDCGVVCVENILIQAGIISNKTLTYKSELSQFNPEETIDLRQTVILKDLIKEGLCTTDNEDDIIVSSSNDGDKLGDE